MPFIPAGAITYPEFKFTINVYACQLCYSNFDLLVVYIYVSNVHEE